MTVAPAVRLLLVTDDSLLCECTAAAAEQSANTAVRSVSSLSAAQSLLSDGADGIECVVLDTDLSPRSVELFHRSLRRERPTLPVILVADRPRSALPATLSYHAFVRKDGVGMGDSVAEAARILAAPGATADYDTPPKTVD